MAQQKLPTMVTPVGTAVYPWITKADTKFNPQGDFRTGLRMPLEVAQPLIDKLEAIRQEALLESKKAKKKPPKEGNLPWSPVYDDDGNETGEIEFKFKTKASGTTKDGKAFTKSIKVFDAKKNEVEGLSIYGGSQIKVAFQAVPYDVAAVGVGLTLRFSAVQVLKLVEGGGGSDASVFGEEDGYVAEKKETNEPSEEDSSDEDF
jgi:hypothetical protein